MVGASVSSPTDTAAEPGPTIAVVHTSFLAVESLTALFAELDPGVRLRHIVDDSLLPEIIAKGGVTAEVEARLRACVVAAASSGADLIFSQCSSVGEAVEAVADGAPVPLVKIDSEMARRACRLGERIGVVATLPTTLGPTQRLIERAARDAGATPRVEAVLVEGAFALLDAGDAEGHDRLVEAAIRTLAERSDVVVCAQGSMARVVGRLSDVGVPLLTSPRLGVEDALRVLGRS